MKKKYKCKDCEGFGLFNYKYVQRGLTCNCGGELVLIPYKYSLVINYDSENDTFEMLNSIKDNLDKNIPADIGLNLISSVDIIKRYA